MPGNNNPITDETGQQLVAALNAMTAAIQANTAQLTALTKEVSDVGETQDRALYDDQLRAMCLQRGVPYRPSTPAPAGY